MSVFLEEADMVERRRTSGLNRISTSMAFTALFFDVSKWQSLQGGGFSERAISGKASALALCLIDT